MKRNILIATVIGVALLIGVAIGQAGGGDDDGMAAALETPAPTPSITFIPTPTPTPTPFIWPTEAPTEAPTEEPLPDLTEPPWPAPKVGTTMTYVSDGCEVDIRPVKVVTWPSNNSFIDPEKGNKFVTVDVLVTGVGGQCPNVGYLYYSLVDADGRQYEPAPAWRDPQLPYDSDPPFNDWEGIKAGKKARGWITYEVPKAVKAGTIAYTGAADMNEWTFSGLK